MSVRNGLFASKADAAALLAGLRAQIQQFDRNMRLQGVRAPVREAIDAGLWPPRMGAALLSIFGGLVLALAMIGLPGDVVLGRRRRRCKAESGRRDRTGPRRGGNTDRAFYDPFGHLWLVGDKSPLSRFRG